MVPFIVIVSKLSAASAGYEARASDVSVSVCKSVPANSSVPTQATVWSFDVTVTEYEDAKARACTGCCRERQG